MHSTLQRLVGQVPNKEAVQVVCTERSANINIQVVRHYLALVYSKSSLKLHLCFSELHHGGLQRLVGSHLTYNGQKLYTYKLCQNLCSSFEITTKIFLLEKSCRKILTLLCLDAWRICMHKFQMICVFHVLLIQFMLCLYIANSRMHLQTSI